MFIKSSSGKMPVWVFIFWYQWCEILIFICFIKQEIYERDQYHQKQRQRQPYLGRE